MKKYRSFAFTVRPVNGISPGSKLEEALLTWLSKQDYGFCCSEMDAEARHIHGQIWLKEERETGAIQRSLERIQEKTDPDWSPAAKKVLRRGVRIAYSKDFVENYLDKEDNILYNSPPEDEDEYYPTQEEQQAVMDASAAVDKKLHRCKNDYNSWLSNGLDKIKINKNIQEAKIPNARYRKILICEFLLWAWYDQKIYPTLCNRKHEQDFIRKLYYYVYPQYATWSQVMDKDFVDKISSIISE